MVGVRGRRESWAEKKEVLCESARGLAVLMSEWVAERLISSMREGEAGPQSLAAGREKDNEKTMTVMK